MSDEGIDLKSLVGEHVLDGVDMFDEQVEKWDDVFEDCQMMRFRLDGIIYLVIEDPDDGYRSRLDKLIISETPMKNIFNPQRVIGRYREKSSEYGGTDDVLELIAVNTGKIVLEVGTENVDDYYPSFMANFMPENFS